MGYMGFVNSIIKYKFSIITVFVFQFLFLFSAILGVSGERPQSFWPSLLLTIFFTLILLFFIYLGWNAVKNLKYTFVDAGKSGLFVGITASVLLGIFSIAFKLILEFTTTTTLSIPMIILVKIMAELVIFYGILGFIFSVLGGFLSTKIGNK